MTRGEPLSPELALVSPELRAQAIALLPAPPRARGVEPASPTTLSFPPARQVRAGGGPLATVEVTVRVPVFAVAAAYLMYGLAVRVTSGVAFATVLVLAHSLVVG